jgi:hypothetical protein
MKGSDQEKERRRWETRRGRVRGRMAGQDLAQAPHERSVHPHELLRSHLRGPAAKVERGEIGSAGRGADWLAGDGRAIVRASVACWLTRRVREPLQSNGARNMATNENVHQSLLESESRRFKYCQRQYGASNGGAGEGERGGRGRGVLAEQEAEWGQRAWLRRTTKRRERVTGNGIIVRIAASLPCFAGLSIRRSPGPIC